MKPELLAPAGSPEALRAAVQNGADAVYLGWGEFNARRSAKNFTDSEFADAMVYCHERGVRVFLTLNTLLSDRELPGALDTARTACALGVDAVLVQDWGLLSLLREALPDLPVHASTQMSVFTSGGAREVAALGMERVVIARECSREDTAAICRSGGVEVEVFVHGALCMCYSGQCAMSALIGGRSGNRGSFLRPRTRQGREFFRFPALTYCKSGCRVSPSLGTARWSPFTGSKRVPRRGPLRVTNQRRRSSEGLYVEHGQGGLRPVVPPW